MELMNKDIYHTLALFVFRDPQDLVENLDSLDRMVALDHRESRDLLDHLDHLDLVDLRDLRVHRDHQERLDHLVPEEKLDPKDPRESLEPMVNICILLINITSEHFITNILKIIAFLYVMLWDGDVVSRVTI